MRRSHPRHSLDPSERRLPHRSKSQRGSESTHTSAAPSLTPVLRSRSRVARPCRLQCVNRSARTRARVRRPSALSHQTSAGGPRVPDAEAEDASEITATSTSTPSRDNSRAYAHGHLAVVPSLVPGLRTSAVVRNANSVVRSCGRRSSIARDRLSGS